jgi:hypothetical protein
MAHAWHPWKSPSEGQNTEHAYALAISITLRRGPVLYTKEGSGLMSQTSDHLYEKNQHDVSNDLSTENNLNTKHLGTTDTNSFLLPLFRAFERGNERMKQGKTPECQEMRNAKMNMKAFPSLLRTTVAGEAYQARADPNKTSAQNP